MIDEDFAFFGFDEVSWSRLVSLFLGDEPEDAHGVLIVVVNAAALPVACFHTARGSLDPQTLGSLDDLEMLCRAHEAASCVVMRERAMPGIELYLSQPLDPDQDFATRVMRFVRVVQELGNGNWLRVWPNPVPDLLLAAAPVVGPVTDLLLPAEHCVVLGVFDEDGNLWTGAALARGSADLHTLAGPAAIAQWAGPLGGDWRRDHRVLVRAVAREVSPVHLGLFMSVSTARKLFRSRKAGEWAMAFVSRELWVQPLPAFAAAALSLDVVGGAAQQALQALEQMDPEEIRSIARGFWHGLTDGKGIEGLLGFSPQRVISQAIERASQSPRAPRTAQEDDPPPDDR